MTYTAEIGGHSWSQGPKAEFETITEAREWAESYGTTADWCSVYKGSSKVAEYMRDRNGNGFRWFRVYT